VFIACATAKRILRFDTASGRILDSITMPESPSGVALSADEHRLFVTCAAPQSVVCIIGVAPAIQPPVSSGSSAASTLDRSSAPPPSVPASRILARIAAGHTAMAPVQSPDSKTLYVCNRFNNSVSVIDLAAMKEVGQIPVRREPVAAALSRDGKMLLVANHLHNEPAGADYVAAMVSAIDLAEGKVTAEFLLPDGSGALNDIRVSPDGKYAAVTHILAQYRPAAGNLRSRWINANALTVIDLGRMEVLASTLLDDRGRGAANPWGMAWSADGSTLVIAHAGTHELSVIDFPPLLKKLLQLPAPFDPLKAGQGGYVEKVPSGYSVPFFAGSRRRLRLPVGDLGPRAVAIAGHTVYVANYFSDTLTALDLSDPKAKAESIPLGTNRWVVAQISKSAVSPISKSARDRTVPGASGSGAPAGLETRDTAGLETCATEMPLVRRGEFYFHDATICFQGWQSCSSCHPGEARTDGLNWDLLNDGGGNSKNTKSLLLAFQTPPAMWLGVRETAETAVRAGLKHILFTDQPEAVALAIDAYLKSLRPVPSPHLAHGQLSDAARRGERVFSQAGCGECHPSPLFTDLRQYDVGTRRGFDRPSDAFDTPALVELWRTAPYLHDGSAATVRDVLTTRNPRDQHGTTSKLSTQELNDLCAYLLSL